MEVKTGELKNNLSRYIKRVTQTGEPVTILDRNNPVALLMPLRRKRSLPMGWEKEKLVLLALAAKHGIHLELPLKKPIPLRDIPISPRSSMSSKNGVNSIVEMRQEKNY
jgi:prevent-host-death family protein